MKWFLKSERWHDIGHSILGFTIGILGPMYVFIWFMVVIYEELVIDKNTSKKFLFDLQSKLISPIVGIIFINTEAYESFFAPGIYFMIVLLLGWKHKLWQE